uniref:Putative negative ABA regulator protein n=1 Tax=Rhizophora mucronata TaxID=61149 RepID=A0A2P2JP38_RHIMU
MPIPLYDLSSSCFYSCILIFSIWFMIYR